VAVAAAHVWGKIRENERIIFFALPDDTICPTVCGRFFSVADDKNDKDFKRSSAEIFSDFLSEAKVKQVRDYVRGEGFKSDRERVRKRAADRIKNLRDRYKSKSRTPEDAARERELTLKLAEVEAEAAEIRIRLSELLEEEERLRDELDLI
jgi:hypothetical protein